MPSSTTLHNDEPNWVSIDAAAERLDVHPRTVRRAISEGRLTGYRLGPRAIRVDLNEVDQLLQQIPTTTLPPRPTDVARTDKTGDTAAAIVDFLRSCTKEERAAIIDRIDAA